jgi:hypothetical protein
MFYRSYTLQLVLLAPRTQKCLEQSSTLALAIPAQTPAVTVILHVKVEVEHELHKSKAETFYERKRQARLLATTQPTTMPTAIDL